MSIGVYDVKKKVFITGEIVETIYGLAAKYQIWDSVAVDVSPFCTESYAPIQLPVEVGNMNADA
jgi:hypothetical protein